MPPSPRDRVAALAGEVHQLVELEVQITEVGPDNVPVGLLALEMQLDQIHQHPLQVGAEFRRRLISKDFGFGST